MATGKKVGLVKKVLREDGERVYVAPETAGDGIFYLQWYEGTTRRREALKAGLTLKQAQKAQDAKAKDLSALLHLTGNGTIAAPQKAADRVLLKDAAAEYLADIKAHKAPKTFNAYSNAVNYFIESCSKMFVDTIDRKDMLAYRTYLADEKGQSERSICNKFENTMSFLKMVGRTGKDMGIVKGDWPDYPTEDVDIYTDGELKNLYEACAEDEAATRWFRFFELTGMREGEVQHCQWSWIDLDARTITVQSDGKGWKPKKNKKRSIPMSTPLFELLKDWRKKTANSDCDLVFPTSGCDVKLDFLDCLKAITKRANLFCGKCSGCVEKNGKPKSEPNCSKWYLHKFRSTFGTRALRAGIDLRTVMEWMGHTDLESTMRYLRPAEGKDAQTKMDAAFAGNGF